jgi:group I intron endonuclease
LPSWRSALKSFSGVYVITDNKTGKHYIGSAYGGEGIWQRFVLYARNVHGGNRELKQLLEKHGKDYFNNFQLSILEVCDLNANKDYVLSRESHWKDVLRSREFGYNEN